MLGSEDAISVRTHLLRPPVPTRARAEEGPSEWPRNVMGPSENQLPKERPAPEWVNGGS